MVSGAPLTQGMASDGELYEVFLTRRCPIWQVREALAVNLPEGHALLDLEDVWLGEAPLPGRVIGAVYEALIAGPGSSPGTGSRERSTSSWPHGPCPASA